MKKVRIIYFIHESFNKQMFNMNRKSHFINEAWIKDANESFD